MCTGTGFNWTAEIYTVAVLHQQTLTVDFFLSELFLFNENVVFLAQAEYFYFCADFRLKIFLYRS